MTFKVTFLEPSNFNVRMSSSQNYKVVAGVYMPKRLKDLSDVELIGDHDKYVLMYDSTIEKWRNVNPDEVLIAATVEESPEYVGIPSVFENQLSIDLDNQIDVDAGTF